MSVDLSTVFGLFHAVDALGELHIGVRPSSFTEAQLPLQAVKMVIDGVDVLPTVPDELEVSGFSYFVKCGMDLYSEKEPDYSPRMVAILADGRKWQTEVNFNGTITMGWYK